MSTTWYVKKSCWDGCVQTVAAYITQAEAEAWAAKLNSERNDSPYFAAARG